MIHTEPSLSARLRRASQSIFAPCLFLVALLFPDALLLAEDAPPMSTQAIAEAELADLEPGKWFDPPQFRSGQRVDLTVAMARNVVRVGPDGRPQQVLLRAYNGLLVGPTWRYRAGDTIAATLNNRLPPEQGPCPSHGHDPNVPHGFNTTNLHTHGLHISPSGISDNVAIQVCPGKDQAYRFHVLPARESGIPPGRHYPGTFWYHAHKHGSTALQLASGMAGALIIEGDIDEVPEIKAAGERIFVFQQLAFDQGGEIKAFGDISCNWAGFQPTGRCNDRRHGPAKHTTVNGVVKPLIELRPGQVERWRFIDAGVFEMLPIELEGHTLHQIAIDGITLRQVTPRGRVEMGPGYRTDVMIKASRVAGRYNLVKGPGRLRLTHDLDAAPGLDAAQILAVVEIDGASCEADPKCPSRLPPGPLPAPVEMLRPIHRAELTNRPNDPRRMVFGRSNEGHWLINGRRFAHSTHADFQLTLGDVEEWLLTNISASPHPFHIHVNAFQMLDERGNPAEWRDTIIVAPGESVRMRTRYERFTGDFVLHCHILFHEDTGMMQNVSVRPRRAAGEPDTDVPDGSEGGSR